MKIFLCYMFLNIGISYGNNTLDDERLNFRGHFLLMEKITSDVLYAKENIDLQAKRKRGQGLIIHKKSLDEQLKQFISLCDSKKYLDRKLDGKDVYWLNMRLSKRNFAQSAGVLFGLKGCDANESIPIYLNFIRTLEGHPPLKGFHGVEDAAWRKWVVGVKYYVPQGDLFVRWSEVSIHQLALRCVGEIYDKKFENGDDLERFLNETKKGWRVNLGWKERYDPSTGTLINKK